jgi:hypothetical protein
MSDRLKTTESEELHETDNQAVNLFGYNFDIDTIIIVFVILTIWFLVWKTTGLFDQLFGIFIFKFIFVLFIVYMLSNILTSGTTSGGVVYELNILLTVEQMISILLGTIIMFTLFLPRLGLMDPKLQDITFKINLSIITILASASMWVTVITSGRVFRGVRKFKQGMYNMALILLIIICMFSAINVKN